MRWPTKSLLNILTKSRRKSKKFKNDTELRSVANCCTMKSRMALKRGTTSLSVTTMPIVSTQPRAITSSMPYVLPMASIRNSIVCLKASWF